MFPVIATHCQTRWQRWHTTCFVYRELAQDGPLRRTRDTPPQASDQIAPRKRGFFFCGGCCGVRAGLGRREAAGAAGSIARCRAFPSTLTAPIFPLALGRACTRHRRAQCACCGDLYSCATRPREPRNNRPARGSHKQLRWGVGVLGHTNCWNTHWSRSGGRLGGGNEGPASRAYLVHLSAC